MAGKGWMKLCTPEGNMKGLQKMMNYFHTRGDEFVQANMSSYSGLASAMNSAQRLVLDREKWEWEKKEVAELRAEIEALKRRRD
jgi:hypothetical protein